ncbi:PREDICTED: uncharacterized protein LOC106820163 [Priapulus caudatus]|uniref:Uncharacterized protein LOC106820163 n=1 Tax=Priapulus caudatus TaxID=37621 RepID=A0ABM1F6X2_PRICU|nr:PREDICTED: uncharacterized protein LOC106820163 [Priapulus caudatus]
MAWVLVKWVEEPPMWDVVEVSECCKELKFLAATKTLKKAIGKVFDFPWGEETGPAYVLDFGKQNTMENKRTEAALELEKSKPAGKGLRPKKRKVLDGEELESSSENCSAETTSTSTSRKVKKVDSFRRDQNLFDDLERKKRDESNTAEVCGKCEKYDRLKKKYREQKERIRSLEKEVKQYKDIAADAGCLVNSRY